MGLHRWALLAGVACGGVASAQSSRTPAALAGGSAPAPVVSSPARGQAPPTDTVLVMKTAGQPDRRLRVLNVSNFSDGESLADVQDVDSGQKFSIPGRMVAHLKRVGETTVSPPPAPAPAVAQTPPPKATPNTPPSVGQPPPVRPLRSDYEVTRSTAMTPSPAPVRPPATVPDSLPPVPVAVVPTTPAPAVTITPPPVVSPPPVSPPPVSPPAMAITPPPVAAPVVAPARPATITWRATGEAQAVAPQPTAPSAPQTPTVTLRRDVWSAVKPDATSGSQTKPAVVTPQLQTLPSAAMPGSQPKLSPDPVPPPTTGPQVRGQAPEPTHGFVHLKPRVAEERQQIEQAGYSGYPTRQSFEQQLMSETKQHVYELYTAVRPSLREDAATALAEGRFASRPEVKQVLAKAALADPAPSVRAHCIRLLSALGYHDSEYTEYLRTCESTGNATIRVSATMALARLTPR